MWWCPVILQGVPLKIECFEEHTAAFSMSRLLSRLVSRAEMAKWWFPLILQGVSQNVACFESTQLLFQWVCMILSALVCRAGMAKWWCPVILQGVPLKVGCCVEHTAAFQWVLGFLPIEYFSVSPLSVGALQTRTTEGNVRRIVKRGEQECTVLQTCLGELCTRAAAAQGSAQWLRTNKKR